MNGAKIHVKNKAEAERFQLNAFKLGYHWTDGTELQFLNKPYFYIDYRDHSITFSNSPAFHFDNHEFDEVKLLHPKQLKLLKEAPSSIEYFNIVRAIFKNDFYFVNNKYILNKIRAYEHRKKNKVKE